MMRFASYGVAAAIALGAFSVSAQAAPATGDLKATAGTGSGVEKAAYRRCWWSDGVRRCRWIYDDYGYYDDGDYGYPYYGYGYGPGFYFGGGRGHGHFHGGHGHRH